MKTHRFLASFRSIVGGIPASVTHESTARIQGPFKDFLASQQHNQKARRAFLADITGHRDPTPESLSVEVGGHFIPLLVRSTITDSEAMKKSQFATDAHAALFKTAKSLISCAKFGADEYVGIRFFCTNGEGVRYFLIHSTQDGRKFADHECVAYPEHHLTAFCL